MTLTTDTLATPTTPSADDLSATTHSANRSAALPEWNEPAGLTARGTLIVLAGRGEAGGVYERFGRRLSADSYRVRVVEDPTRDVAAARARVAALLADPDLPSPKVLVGSDAGAALALAALADTSSTSAGSTTTGTAAASSTSAAAAAAAAAGLILVGLPVNSTPADSSGPVDDTELRSACPVHRRTLANPALVTSGALSRPLPDELASALEDSALEDSAPRGLPILAIHGEADAVSPVNEALAFYRSLEPTGILTITDGRHDALNDVSHRSVAAAIVQFLERIRLAGADGTLPRVLNDVSLDEPVQTT